MISTATGYAASALGYLAVRADGPMPVRDLARAVDVPAPYLSKIIHLLALRGLVDTTNAHVPAAGSFRDLPDRGMAVRPGSCGGR